MRRVPETLLKTVLFNLDSAKKDLDKHWRYLIFGTAVSLAIAAGLGPPVANKYLGIEGADPKLLFLLMPLVNLYLFMRFGFLLAYFTGVRLAAEDLAGQYFVEEKVRSELLSPHLLFGTNSFFEYIHERKRKFGLLLYALFILVTVALNNALSLLLWWQYFDGILWWRYLDGSYRYVAVGLYLVALMLFCYHYYDVNNARRINVIGSKTIAISVSVELILTAIFFLCFIR